MLEPFLAQWRLPGRDKSALSEFQCKVVSFSVLVSKRERDNTDSGDQVPRGIVYRVSRSVPYAKMLAHRLHAQRYELIARGCLLH